MALIPLQYEGVMHYDMIAVTGTDVDKQILTKMAKDFAKLTSKYN